MNLSEGVLSVKPGVQMVFTGIGDTDRKESGEKERPQQPKTPSGA
jgi:hypothetical protein